MPVEEQYSSGIADLRQGHIVGDIVEGERHGLERQDHAL